MLQCLLSVIGTVVLSQTRDDDPARTRGQSCHLWELRIAPQSRSGQSHVHVPSRRCLSDMEV
jgi:hypothetical protein